MSVPLSFPTVAVTVFAAGLFFFANQYRTLRDTYPRRIEDLKAWAWADVSQDLRDLFGEISTAASDRLDFEDRENPEDQVMEAVETAISEDFDPADIDSVIEGVQNAREPRELYESLQNRYLLLSVICGIMVAISLGALFVVAEPSNFLPITTDTLVIAYSYPALFVTYFGVESFKKRSRLQDLWEDYRWE